MKKNIFIDPVNSIEWYDGTVRGVSKTQSQYLLIVLVEWEIRVRRKYVLLEISHSSYEKLLNCFKDTAKTKKQKWHDFEMAYENIINSYSKTTCFVLLGEIDGVKQIEIEIVKFEDYIPKLQKYDFEDVIVS
jgi:hypothetical protein